VINSLMSRKDDNKGIKIPIGIIPSGTGNGLSKSILEVSGEAYDPVNAAFLIVKGKTKSIDLMLTQQNNQIYYSILSLSWGLISDVDVESEKLRFLGSLRNDLYAIIRIMFLKSYRGKFYFLPAFNKVFSEDLAIKQEDGWYLIEADFVLFWAMNVPWASHSFQPTPQAKLDDGMIDILIVRKGVSRSKLLKALLLIGEGKHLDLNCFEYYKVISFRLEPSTEKGILAVDGEKVNYLPVTMESRRGLVQFFG
jgi:sphingosine kinase